MSKEPPEPELFKGLPPEETEREREQRQRREWQKRYRTEPENVLKQVARERSARAEKAGKLVRPDCCECCGEHCKLERHHEDHSKAFEVDWLCKACHVQRHVELARKEGGQIDWVEEQQAKERKT